MVIASGVREEKAPLFLCPGNEEVEALDEIKRMGIWYADLPLKEGSCVQGGRRPVVIISNDICNECNSVITVAPMTRQMKRLGLPTHTVIDSPDGGLSVVLAEQITTIDKSRLDYCMGKVAGHDVGKVEAAIMDQLGMKGEEDE